MPKKFPASEDPLKKMKSVWFPEPPKPEPVIIQKDDAPAAKAEAPQSDSWQEPAPLSLSESIEEPRADHDAKRGFEKTNRRTVYYLAHDQPLRLKCIADMKRKALSYFVQDILEDYLSKPENQKLYRDFRRLYPDRYEEFKKKLL